MTLPGAGEKKTFQRRSPPARDRCGDNSSQLWHGAFQLDPGTAEGGDCSVHPSTISRALRAAGMRFKRTAQRHWSPDPDYMPKIKHIEQLVQQASSNRRRVVLYADEAFAHLRPTCTRWYSPRGQQPRQVGTGSVDRRRCIFGAVNPITGDLYHLHRYNGAARHFVAFLKNVLNHHPKAERIDLVTDSWGVHTSELTQQFLDSHTKLQIHLLPTYAPWLNHQEKLWRQWRKYVTHGHPFSSMEEILHATDRFFDELNQHKQRVLRLIGQCGN